jgi:hypothetical protein
MPSYADSLEPEQAWDLIVYVLSLSEANKPLAASGGLMSPSQIPPGHGGMPGIHGGHGEH